MLKAGAGSESAMAYLELNTATDYPSDPKRPRKKLMKISARNRLKGMIVDIKKGATTAHVRIGAKGKSSP